MLMENLSFLPGKLKMAMKTVFRNDLCDLIMNTYTGPIRRRPYLQTAIQSLLSLIKLSTGPTMGVTLATSQQEQR